jgi:hypothetical protein
MIYVFIKNNERYFRLKRCAKFSTLVKGVIINGKANLFLIGNKELCLLKKNNFYFESKQRYGSPRMTVELAFLGSKVSRITVAKYMNQLGLRSKLSKKFKVTTNSKHNHLIVF